MTGPGLYFIVAAGIGVAWLFVLTFLWAYHGKWPLFPMFDDGMADTMVGLLVALTWPIGVPLVFTFLYARHWGKMARERREQAEEEMAAVDEILRDIGI